jgi:hypothetical protein
MMLPSVLVASAPDAIAAPACPWATSACFFAVK